MTGFRTMTVGLGLAALLAIGCNCHKNACRPAPPPCCNGAPGAPERIPPQPAVGDAGPYGPPPVIPAPPR